MKKWIICIISALIFCTTYVYTYVYAEEEDILSDPIVKEEEDIKEDEPLLKGTGNTNNTKSYVTNPMQAQVLLFAEDSAYSGKYGIKVNNISIGTNYIVEVKANSDTFWRNYVGYEIKGTNGYFVRGSESIGQSIIWEKDGNIISGYKFKQFQTYESGFQDWFVAKEYIEPEPTPEPTPDPTPEPEPEIDPETISSNELLREILITNRGIAKDVENLNKLLSNNSVPDSVLSDNSVSNNLINKPLSEYDLKESLLLFIILLGLSAGLVYIIHKSIFKWG